MTTRLIRRWGSPDDGPPVAIPWSNAANDACTCAPAPSLGAPGRRGRSAPCTPKAWRGQRVVKIAHRAVKEWSAVVGPRRALGVTGGCARPLATASCAEPPGRTAAVRLGGAACQATAQPEGVQRTMAAQDRGRVKHQTTVRRKTGRGCPPAAVRPYRGQARPPAHRIRRVRQAEPPSCAA